MLKSINITKRKRRRKLKNGATVVQTRYVLNYREPRTGKRRQLFFELAKDAQSKRNEIIAAVETGTYAGRDNESITVREAVKRWLDDRLGKIKASTHEGYRRSSSCVVGPLLIGTQKQRFQLAMTGKQPSGTELIPMLGDVKVPELTTSDIRTWHRTVATHVGWHTANRGKTFLKAALDLLAEDTNIRPPAMPSSLGRGKPKLKKRILTTDQVATLLRAAQADHERGIYVAFPFLAGTRPSEQLGLLWEDVDFEANVIRIQRMQERDGAITNLTKTVAGTRDVPMCSLLRSMLLEWRVACPRERGELYRVFPGFGQQQPWPLPRTGGGGPLLYQNFRRRVWVPMLRRLNLPLVTPHSARHCFISTLQAQGIEVGLVAKLAGHSNAVVTLGHYTQAVRGGQEALTALEQAYTA